MRGNFFKRLIFNYSLLAIILFALTLAIYFKFALFNLDKFYTADEHLWTTGGSLLLNESSDKSVGRIEKYWLAMGNEDWEKTRVNDKPGISLAYVSGLGYLFGENPGNLIIEQDKTSITYDTEAMRKMLINYRLPLIIFTGLISIFFFIYLWRLTKNHWIALVASSLITLSPILLGISRIINPDTLLWPTALASILSFFVFLKYGRFVDVLISAIFLGFALLSKYVALILLPFYLIMALVFIFFEQENLTKDNILIKRMRQIFLGYPFVVAGGIGLFALLMPALLVKDNLLYKSTLGFGSLGSKLNYLAYAEIFFLIDSLILRGFITRWTMKQLRFLRFILPRILYLLLLTSFSVIFINFVHKENFLHIGEVVFKLKDISMDLFLNGIAPQMNPLIFSLTPIVLFLMLFFWLKSIFRRSVFDYIAFPLSIFIVIYYYAMYVQKVILNPRYSILLFPMAIIIATLGFYELLNILRIKKYGWLSAVLSVIIIFVSYLTLEKSRPFYFNYASDMLPHEYSFSKGWGYGGYEAAGFMNSHLNCDKNPVAWADYYGFCLFFEGKCLYQNSPRWAKKETLESIDYFMISAQGQRKNGPSFRKIMETYPQSRLVWRINIGGRPDNYVMIYKIDRQKNSLPALDTYPPVSSEYKSLNVLEESSLKHNQIMLQELLRL